MKYKQGFYKPKNPEKYIHINNSLNENNRIPKYRSSWELKFFRYCDLNQNITYWTSEPFGIPYYHPFKEKICRYYPDFLIIKNNQKYLIEIKPSKEAKTPKNFYDKSMFMINQAKWKAANEYCLKNNIIFCVITEKELKI